MIEKHICKNGLRIVSEHVPAVRSVTIGIWVLTGSRYENKLNNGISHFLEHMFFKGTKTRTAQDIAEAFDSIGGYINAFTSKEYTCYYAKVLDNQKEFALELLADMFFNSMYEEKEIKREKNVVLEEIKMYEDTPDDIVHDMLAYASFGKHALGYPILGTEKQLDTFTNASLREYMKNYYTPEKIVLSIAGNIDDHFIKKVEQHFGSFEVTGKREQTSIPSFYPDHLQRTKETEQAHLCIGFEGLPVYDENMFSMVLLNNILGGSMSSRLFQEVREKKGLAYSVFSYHTSYLDTGLLTIYAGTGKDQLPLLKDTLLDTINQLLQDGVTDKELKNSKEQLKGNIVLGLESTSSRMSRNGRNELLLQRHRSLDELIHSIDSVTHQQMDDMIGRVFNQDFSSALVAPKN